MKEELKKIAEANPEKTDLREAVSGIRNGQLPKGNLYAESHALSAFFIEKIWPKFEEEISRLLETEGELHNYFFLIFPETKNDRKMLFRMLLYFLVARWRANTIELNEEMISKNDPAYMKMNHLVQLDLGQTAVENLDAGFRTSGDAMWGLIEIFLKKFEETHGKKPNTKEIDEFLENPENLTFLITMANASMGNMKVFLAQLMDLSDASRSIYRPEAFEIEGNKIKIKKGALNYSPEDIRQITRFKSGLRTGCPALAANSDGSNIVVKTWELIKRVFREVYYPTLEERHM
jgi:hypothetical protein